MSKLIYITNTSLDGYVEDETCAFDWVIPDQVHGVDGVVHLIKGYSHDIVSSWTQPIDLLFIDGNHEYPAVRRDFDDWARFLVSGGLLVMDDASPASRKVHKGPNQVVRESVAGHPDWHAGVHVGTLYSARKR